MAVFLSRLPFLNAGYGLDPDALRVVNTARLIRASGVYSASRFPGYPVQEYVVSLLIPWGEWAVNGMSAVLSSVAVVGFALCLQELAVPAAWLLALALAAVRIVYINSTCAMDYVWALGFVMLAAWLTLKQRMWLAGLCLGLAIGVRITSGAMLVPLTCLCLSRRGGSAALRALARLVCATLTVAGLCFVPVFRRYGFKAFTYTDALGGGSAETILRRATFGVWGVLGTLVVAGALVYALLTLRSELKRAGANGRGWASIACISAIALYTVAYLKLPHEAGYLIPIVPFVIWLVAMWITGPSRTTFAVLVLVSACLEYRDDELTLSAPVISDHRERSAVESHIRELVDAAAQLEKPSVIVAGYRLPAIEAKLGDLKTEKQRWLYSIKSEQQFSSLRAKGFDIYFADRATESYQRRINGLKLRQMGARALLSN